MRWSMIQRTKMKNEKDFGLEASTTTSNVWSENLTKDQPIAWAILFNSSEERCTSLGERKKHKGKKRRSMLFLF